MPIVGQQLPHSCRTLTQAPLLTFSLFLAETPILGNRIVMRKETMKAFEHRREEVLQERQTKMQEKQQSSSKMRTLGASNPHNNNKDRHRGAGANTRVTGDTVGQIFGGGGGAQSNGGVDNLSYEK
jgi:hypothetical protein